MIHEPLDDRTKIFAKKVRSFLRTIPYSRYLLSDIDQLIRSSGSVGANFIEARDAFTKKDFIYRIKICRKEARESCYWLELIQDYLPEDKKLLCKGLFQDSDEFVRIFTTIAKNAEEKNSRPS